MTLIIILLPSFGIPTYALRLQLIATFSVEASKVIVVGHD